jgi:4-aminobutyrate aminotransferase-like enzyme
LKIKERFKEVGDVRVKGVMNAIEFVKDGDSNLLPYGELCQSIVQGMRENGLIPSAPVLIKKYDQNSYLLST